MPHLEVGAGHTEKVAQAQDELVVLRLRMADLFTEQESIVSKLDVPTANIKGTIYILIILKGIIALRINTPLYTY